MIVLEKDKVYKIEHPECSGDFLPYDRNYIIFSPLNDIIVEDDYFSGKPSLFKHINFRTHFTICLDGNIITEVGSSGIQTHCRILQLLPSDLKDIKRAINALKGKYKYNRKLNQLIINDSIRGK